MKRSAKKRWGQHFLTDTNLLNKLVELINPTSEDSILEIGPGGGALTELLAPIVKELVGIEIDRELYGHLKERDDLPNCQFVNRDFLKVDLEEIPFKGGQVRVVGNLPYNITSPILFKLMIQDPFWCDCHFMVQKEVAERMAAKAGTKAYGRLSVNLQAVAKVKIVLTVPPEVFVPKPKVDSAVVKIQPRSSIFDSPRELEALQEITSLAFGQRRKMLRNSLASLEIDSSFFDLTLRPEKVKLEEFTIMAKWFVKSSHVIK
ncbi:MAG TPA: 16S rRNA (adenine(1518)-N(6)/adenine(1519)-N(6))-dimethyltransferase RsmA [Candidatus Marinimicrobia bacterium]|nr:16S rRNA (adenine(1518)-N(6)/adenine(1519)-N(6))-dimethyltransferase RsmA [Candidatus Neomarinimicrobiota bacterium]